MVCNALIMVMAIWKHFHICGGLIIVNVKVSISLHTSLDNVETSLERVWMGFAQVWFEIQDLKSRYFAMFLIKNTASGLKRWNEWSTREFYDCPKKIKEPLNPWWMVLTAKNISSHNYLPPSQKVINPQQFWLGTGQFPRRRVWTTVLLFWMVLEDRQQFGGWTEQFP